MPNENLTIGAVGVGAVGTILAACLAEAGAEVVVSDIPVRNSQIDNNGLRVYLGRKKIQPQRENRRLHHSPPRI